MTLQAFIGRPHGGDWEYRLLLNGVWIPRCGGTVAE